MIAASIRAQVMRLPESERLDYAIDLVGFYLDPVAPFLEGLAALDLRLPPQETRILYALERRRGRLVSTQTLLGAAAGDRVVDDWPSAATITRRISAIRSRLRGKRLPVQIIAWSGVGYRLAAPDDFRFEVSQ